MIDIIIIICCILVGFALGKFLERKVLEKGKFYQDLCAYVSLLKDNITGRQLQLSAFNESFALNNSSKAFADYLLKREVKVHMTKLQRESLTAFFNMDCVSSQAFVEHINYYEKILTEDAQKVLQGEVAKASIYYKLGMLLGAMVGILLV